MTPDKPISVAVVLLGSILCLVLPRRYALVPLALSMCLYPVNLILPPESLAFTPQRVIAMVLLARCLISTTIRSRFRWSIADSAAAVYFLLVFLAQLYTTHPMSVALNNRLGFLLSAMVPFWCARFLIVDRESLYALLKGWLWAGVPLAILGLNQMVTGYNPYIPLLENGILWTMPKGGDLQREFLGQLYFRAYGPFLQAIMFGWFFALLLAPCTNLYWQKRKVLPWILGWVILPLGTISSLAGGPKMMVLVSVLLLGLFPLRRWAKKGALVSAVLYIAVSFLARRSPMEFIAEFGTDPLSSWYRVGLVRFVLGYGMNGHWIFGYGETPPGLFDQYHDLVIHWVFLLVYYGIVGCIGFYALLAAVGWRLWQARDRAMALEDQWLLWSFMAALLGSLLAMFVAALFSEMYYIYHLFLGVTASVPTLIGGSVRQVGLLAQADGRTVLLRYTLKPGQRLAVLDPSTGQARHY